MLGRATSRRGGTVANASRRRGFDFAESPSHRAFTIIELLVVIGVIGILLGLIFPGLGLLRRSAQNTQCLSNLRQLWTPIEAYRSAHRGLLPNCEFLPAASATGPIGGLPTLLSGYLPQDCDCWFCAADHDESSRETGTSYFYLPGLLKFTPEVQLAVAQMLASHPPGSIPQKELDRKQRELESKLVGAFIGNDPKSLYPLLLDSADRHGHGRNPRNGVFVDGSARELTTVDEEDAEEEAGNQETGIGHGATP
ncbi:MAG: type II secretion system protein [Phycisphaerae bacterium]|nr:type II secretion system protein [Phycisphaerae bacterium]